MEKDLRKMKNINRVEKERRGKADSPEFIRRKLKSLYGGFLTFINKIIGEL